VLNDKTIEEVAKAIYYSWENYPHASDRSWDKLNEKLPGAVEVFKKHAVAAIGAIAIHKEN